MSFGNFVKKGYCIFSTVPKCLCSSKKSRDDRELYRCQLDLSIHSIISDIILVSKGLFSVLGQHIMTERKLHVSNYRQIAYQHV